METYKIEKLIRTLGIGATYRGYHYLNLGIRLCLEDENYLLPTIENPDFVTYSFRYDGYSSDVKSYDDEGFAIRYFQISSVEFVPYEGESIDTASPFYLDSRYGKINLISPTVFELNGEYYEIVSNAQYWAYTYCRLEGK